MTRMRLVLIFLLTFAAQAWFARSFAVDLGDEPDGRIYLAYAHNLSALGVYSSDETAAPVPDYIRLPGYPWVLAGVFALCGEANLSALRIFQAFLATLVCAGVGWLAFLWEPMVTRKARAGWAAFVLAALCPFTAIYAAVIQAETLTLFLSVATLLAATWAFRAQTSRQALGRWVVAGLLAGTMQMVRPESGLLAAAVGLTLVGGALFAPDGSGRRVSLPAAVVRGAVFSCAFALVLVPWTWRNVRVCGVFAPLPPANAALPGEADFSGFTAWYRTWADSERSLEPYYWGMTDGEPASTVGLPERAFDSDAERARTEELFARYNAPDETAETGHKPRGLTPELNAAFGQLARERVARAPWRHYLFLPLRRAMNLWFGPHATYYSFDGPLVAGKEGRPDEDAPYYWLPVFFGVLCAYTVAALAGWWRLARAPAGGRRWAWLAALTVGLRWAYLATLENTESRYMVELFPLVCVLGGIALGAVLASRGEDA